MATWQGWSSSHSPLPLHPSTLLLPPHSSCDDRDIDERDVQYTPTPGHVGGFGAIVDRIGRGFPRSVQCGRDYTVVCTWPYEGPNFDVCSKLMEEQKIREEEALLQNLQNAVGAAALHDEDD